MRARIYNNPSGSILAVILFHATLNLAAYVMIPITNQVPAYSILNYYLFIVLLTIVIAVIIVYGLERLVRQTKKQIEAKL